MWEQGTIQWNWGVKMGKRFSRSWDYIGKFIAEGSGRAKYFTSFQKELDFYVAPTSILHCSQWQYSWDRVFLRVMLPEAVEMSWGGTSWLRTPDYLVGDWCPGETVVKDVPKVYESHWNITQFKMKIHTWRRGLTYVSFRSHLLFYASTQSKVIEWKQEKETATELNSVASLNYQIFLISPYWKAQHSPSSNVTIGQIQS